jgi:delta-aminolevulinic acid dehydratase/porphobilinogen synthase
MERAVGTGLIGSPEVIVEQLLGMARAGVELCVLHLAGDGRKVDHREQMELIAERVLPALRVPPG